MSAFYRPLRGQLSGRARELWQRCDLCHWSGEFTAFRLFVNADDRHFDVCLTCLEEPETQRMLRETCNQKWGEWP